MPKKNHGWVGIFFLITDSEKSLLGRKWCHTVVPPQWQQLYTGSLPAASCVLGVDSSSLEKGPSNGLVAGGGKDQVLGWVSRCPLPGCCNCRHLLQGGKSVVSGASGVFQRNQGEDIQVEFHSGWYFLFCCCSENVSGLFHCVNSSLYK